MRRATCRVMFQTPYPVCERFGLMMDTPYSRAWDIGCPTVKLETHLQVENE